MTLPADKLLRLSPDRLFALLDGLVALATPDGTVLRLGPRWRPPDGRAIDRLHELLTPDDEAALEAALARVRDDGHASLDATLRAGGHELAFELGGSEDWLLFTAAPRGPDPLVMSAVADGAGVGLTLLDAAGYYRYVNPVYCTIYGYPAEELLGRHFTMVFPAGERERANAHHEALLRGEREGHSRELQVQRRDGSPMLIDTCSRRIERPDGALFRLATVIDITHIRAAEHRLADTESRLGDIAESLPGAIFRLVRDQDGRFALTYMSEGLRHICGLGDDFPIGDFDRFLGLIPEPERHELLRALQVSERTLAPLHQEFRLITPGDTYQVEARSIPQPQPGGGIVCNGLLVDVTDRHRARAEADRLNAILESTPDCVAITDTQGEIRYLNAGGRELLELDETVGVIGRSFFDFLSDGDRARILDHASREAARYGTWSGEATLITARGRRRPVSQTILCHRDSTGRVDRFSTVIRDLSERIAVEAELRASEERLRVLYHRTPTLLHSVDPEGRLIAVSDYWLEQLGYSRTEVIGRQSVDFFTPESRRRALEEIRPGFWRDGYCRNVPFRVVRADGKVRDVLLSAVCHYDDAGEVVQAVSVMNDVTEQRRAEASYQDIFENANEGIYRSAPDGRLLRANPALARLHGYADEAELLANMRDVGTEWFVDPGSRARLLEALEHDDRVTDFEAEIVRHASGERIWTSENARVIRDGDGRVRYYEGTVRDITARYRAARIAEGRGEILEMIARERPLGAILHEIAGLIERNYTGVTAAVLRLQDGRLYTAAAPGLASGCRSSMDGQSPSQVGGVIAATLDSDRPITDSDFSAERHWPLQREAHAAGYRSLTAAPVRDQEGEPLAVLAAFTTSQYADRSGDDGLLREMAQITSIALEQYRLAQELVHQAQYDSLTDLPNRALLNDRLAQGILDAQRDGRELAVLLLDLDEFKLVNDTLGHSAGDELLQQVAARLRNCVRAGDTVARLGGDEFVVMGPLPAELDATRIAERVLAALQPGARVAGREVTARPSIGISVYPQDGTTAEQLLQAADTAMYAAKHAGKNGYRYFAEMMNTQVSERLRLESDLRGAIGNGELELFYQPRIELAGRRLDGAEALLRWNHPERGQLAPDCFLPIAERGPLIGQIDRYVLHTAAAVLAEWQQGGRALVLAANISARELHADGFGAEVARILNDTGVDPRGLELEITESMLMVDFQHASAQLADLKARAPGLRIAIDDFGSGYSSLNYLRHLPIDTLKVDRAFVHDTGDPASADAARAIVRTIVELGRSLGLNVVAEGVETAAQADLMQELGCHTAQGYWFDGPLPRAAFDQRLGDSPP